MRVEVASHGQGLLTIRSPIIESDTAGQFAGVARGPGFRLPGELILPRLRLILGRREFASSITVGSGPCSVDGDLDALSDDFE